MNKILLLIIFLGILLRLQNISPYHFYPDVYQNLLVAENIKNYGSVLGPLGTFGYLFPPFILWTRPAFPLLIALLSFITQDPMQSGHIIAFLAGIAAIPVSYIVMSAIWYDKRSGIAAAALTALSFQHVVWSGNVMTETLGNLAVLGALWVMIKKRNDILSGLLLAAMIFTRYEYALLLLPFGIWLITHKLFYTLFYTLAISVVTLASLFPITQIFSTVTSQVSGTIPAITPSGIATFVQYDPLISLLFLFGLIMMIVQKKYTLSFFTMLAIILLYTVYYRSNPHQSRYITHLLPFLLIPASYAVAQFQKTPLKFIVFLLCIYQGTLSFVGIKNWSNGDYTRTSYEEQSATLVSEKISNKNTLLIASFPEPYYFFTKIPTNSVSNNYPYLFVDAPDDQHLTIIVDMGMRDLFPNFARLVKSNVAPTHQYTTNLPYYYAGNRSDETKSVEVYETTLEKLKKTINDENSK